MDFEKLTWNEKGLIPAIVQDAYTGSVLMMAWMNRESLQITLDEGYTCFFSRSRNELWRKGKSSGNTQKVVSIDADCDGDTLLVRVAANGPACHTGANSCFFRRVHGGDTPEFSVDGLYALIQNRKANPKEGSYTNYLFDKGVDKILKKVGEESAEVIIAAKNNSESELVYEMSDLCYHSLVLLAQQGISPGKIRQELASRHKDDK